mgnify:CR=1 FL=1
MALDFVKGQAVSIGNRVFKKVAGNLPGLLGITKGRGGDTSDFAGITATKYNTKNYSFPIDVEGPPGVGNHGHYIMFMINEQEGAELKFGEREKSKGKETLVEEMASRNIPKVVKELKSPAQYAQTNITGEKVKVKEAQFGLRANTNSIGKYGLNTDSSNQDKLQSANYQTYNKQTKIKASMSKEAQAIHVERAATTRMKTAIALFMPASVQVQYGANYTDTEIGSMAERGANAIKAFYEGDAGKGIRTILDADKTLLENAGQFLLAGIGNIPGFGGAKELESMKKGRIISNRMELAFKGINKRSFQYTFKMMPRNKKESDEIKKIVHAFKFNMLPEFEGSDLKGRSFIVPNTFDIEYMYNGKQNQFLHKISTCVLESMDVTYGGDRYKTYTATAEGAPPQETTIALNFKEMEMITRERVEDGF